jgi:hypothetical protein
MERVSARSLQQWRDEGCALLLVHFNPYLDGQERIAKQAMNHKAAGALWDKCCVCILRTFNDSDTQGDLSRRRYLA